MLQINADPIVVAVNDERERHEMLLSVVMTSDERECEEELNIEMRFEVENAKPNSQPLFDALLQLAITNLRQRIRCLKVVLCKHSHDLDALQSTTSSH